MITKFAILLMTIMVLSNETSFSQASTRTNDAVDELRQANIDTLILFSQSQHSQQGVFTGLGKVIFSQLSYVFYKKDGETFAQQTLEYCNADCSMMTRATSKPLKLEGSSLFAFSNSDVQRIQSENIRPYTYKAMDSVTGKEYDQVVGSHHSTVEIVIMLATVKIQKSVSLVDLEDLASLGFSPNLNYPYNSKTKLKELIDLLVKSSESLHNKFRY